MRVGWTVAGGTALAAGISLSGLGLFIARRLTAPVEARKYELTIRGVDTSGDEPVVLLDRTPRTAAAGSYCLLLEDGGWIQLSSEVEDRGRVLVARRVSGVLRGELAMGIRASWSGIYFSDPHDVGLDAADVEIPTDVGLAPAWLIAPRGGASTTWAIHIHGLGSHRAGTLRGVQVAVEAGLTSLVVSYRNDGEGPTIGEGRSSLGATEADDVRSALRFAKANGACRFILFGWSMGGAIALQLAADAEFRGLIAGLVLESPITDWVSTIKANCARAGLPAWTGNLASPWLDRQPLARIVGLRAPVDLSGHDWIARSTEIAVPTLMLHGREDTSSPFDSSVRLEKMRPDVVCLEAFDADHTLTWNSDPTRWRAVVHSWLASSELTADRGVFEM